MKVENETTGHNRTLRFTNLPATDRFDPGEVLVTVSYVSRYNDPGVIIKAAALDHIIIPSIIEAINNKYDK